MLCWCRCSCCVLLIFILCFLLVLLCLCYVHMASEFELTQMISLSSSWYDSINKPISKIICMTGVYTLEGCYSVSNGRAAFKLVFKLVLFSKTLEGCYSVSNVHTAFTPDQFISLILWAISLALVLVWKQSPFWKRVIPRAKLLFASIVLCSLIMQQTYSIRNAIIIRQEICRQTKNPSLFF